MAHSDLHETRGAVRPYAAMIEVLRSAALLNTRGRIKSAASMQSDPKYWFPAKRYGWGWGMPRCWQGWVVLALFFALLVTGPFLFPPATDIIAYLVYIAVLSALLIGVCWLKGEPPRWRWGNGERD